MIEALRLSIKNTPLLSPSALQLLERNADPDCELEEIVNIVRYDAALTAKVLKTVNSTAFGLVSTVESVDRAIYYLGSWLVAGLAIVDSTAQMMQKPLVGYEGESGTLWRHDLFTAFAAREIAGLSIDGISTQTAFTAGLLHDIGKALVSEHLRGTAGQVLKSIETGDTEDYLAAERDLLGADHAEVGFEVAKVWGLPTVLQEVIRHHHHPDQAPEEVQSLAYAVHLGDLVAMMGGYGTGSDSLRHRLLDNYSDSFDLDFQSLEQVLLVSQESFAKAEALMAIDEKEVS